MPASETVEGQEPSSRYVRPPVRIESCLPEEGKHEDTPPIEERISPSSKSAKPPVAVFVVHGMGQQIRFETLDRTAKCLLKAAGAHPETPINVRTLQVRDQLMRRAEFELEDKSNGADPQEVHVYEGYCAPITEGRIVLTDVLWFLFYAGIRTFGGQGRRMQRWMFGRSVTFSIPVETRNAFSLTFFVFLSLVVIGALVSVWQDRICCCLAR